MIPSVGDERSRDLAAHLKQAATELTGMQHERVVRKLAGNVFVSHTSADDPLITGVHDRGLPKHRSIWWLIAEIFRDPFYHSRKTGGADEYARIVGLAMLSSKRVLIVWSQNVVQSDFVRAEILIAMEGKRQIGVLMLPDAPKFPFEGVELVFDLESLSQMLKRWKNTAVAEIGTSQQ
jgi:hypothetical protein